MATSTDSFFAKLKHLDGFFDACKNMYAKTPVVKEKTSIPKPIYDGEPDFIMTSKCKRLVLCPLENVKEQYRASMLNFARTNCANGSVSISMDMLDDFAYIAMACTGDYDTPVMGARQKIQDRSRTVFIAKPLEPYLFIVPIDKTTFEPRCNSNMLNGVWMIHNAKPLSIYVDREQQDDDAKYADIRFVQTIESNGNTFSKSLRLVRSPDPAYLRKDSETGDRYYLYDLSKGIEQGH